MTRLLLVLSCLCLMCMGSFGYADWLTIPNGSFEDGLNNWDWAIFNAGSGYVQTASSLVWGSETVLANDGSYFLQIGGPRTGEGRGIVNSRVLDLAPGQTLGGVIRTVGDGGGTHYLVTAASVSVYRVNAGLEANLDLTFTPDSGAWVPWSYTNATPAHQSVWIQYFFDSFGDNTYMLADAGLGSDGNPYGLSVPEPAGLSLGLLALGGFAAARRRKGKG